MPVLKGVVEAELSRIAYEASSEAIERLTLYAGELERWNRTINLTALHNVDLVRRLIVEPIWIGRQLQMSGVLADIGSGNGSPAIPLSLTRDFTTTHMVESRGKRAAFLRHAVTQLGLTKAIVHKSRLEDLSTNLIDVRWVTLQALAPKRDVLMALRRLTSITTQVAWITSGRPQPVSTATHLGVPDSKTEVWVFTLDLS